jgi:hypothetical protein
MSLKLAERKSSTTLGRGVCGGKLEAADRERCYIPVPFFPVPFFPITDQRMKFE